MDFSFSEEQLANKQRVRDYCRQELASRAAELDQATEDEAQEMMRERLRGLGRNGLLGCGFPEDVGGSGEDLFASVALLQELGEACPATGLAVLASVGLCARALHEWGEGQKTRQSLSTLLTGERIGTYGSMEPEAGLDAWDFKTQATQSKEGYRLRGQKTMVLNASVADVAVVSACDGNGVPGLFLVDARASGFQVSPPQGKLGCRGVPTANLRLNDCPSALLGTQAVASVRAQEHLLFAALSAGLIHASMLTAGVYARDTKSGEKPLARHQEVSFKLADMLLFLDTAQILINRCVWLMSQKSRDAEVVASCAKTFASESAVKAAGWALQIMGHVGYERGSVAERLYRDAKLVEILGDSTERHRMFIADQVLAQY